LLGLATGVAEAQPLSGAVITGSTVYSQSLLFALYRDALGHDMDAQAARSILANIESRYVQDGYFKPALRVQEDLLSYGILEIQVQEAQLSDVHVEGQAGPYGARVRSCVDGLRNTSPVTPAVVAEAVRRLRALPGLSVEEHLDADTLVANGLVLTLAVRYRPVTGAVSWSDFGTSEIGPNFVTALLTTNGILNTAEQINLLAVTATAYDNYHGIGGSFAIPVTSSGTSFSLSGFHSRATPSFAISSINLALDNDSSAAQLTTPLLVRSQLFLNGTLGIGFDDASIRYTSLNLETDRLRFATAGVQFNSQAERLATDATVQLRHGFGGLGAAITDIEGDQLKPDYTLARGNGSWGLPLNSLASVRVSWSGQWSPDTLSYQERFKIGTETIAPAFKTAIFAGDSGAGGRAETRLRLPWLTPPNGNFSAFAYADYAETWQHDTADVLHAMTAGGGLRLSEWHALGSIEVARPIRYSGTVPYGTAVIGNVTIGF
jgi:hemolysin activation/secretion protein